MSTATTAPELGPYTLADWHAADQPADGSRLELLAGSWLVTPPPGGSHQYAGDRLWRALDDAITTAGRNDLRAVTAVGTDISSSRRDGLIPDVVICSAPVPQVVDSSQLQLVVEVWSPGNSKSERSEKRRAYARAGVAYLWELHLPGPVQNMRLDCHQLAGQVYTLGQTLTGAESATVTTAPVPVPVDLGRLANS